MEITAKKLAANRRNAKLSTGPTSPAGKAVVAKNALKHGLLAGAVVVATPASAESQESFDALLADLVADLAPVGLLEESLVERIATCYWRLRRVQRYEARLLHSAPDPHRPEPDEIARIRRDLQHNQASLAHDQRIAALLDKSPDALSADEAAELKKWMDDFDRGIGASIKNLGIENRTARDVLETTIDQLQSEVDHLSAQLRAAEHRAAQSSVHDALSAFLPEDRDLLKVVRYESMLDRQIHRALAELHLLRSESDKRRDEDSRASERKRK